ncbi:hypothetical protein BVY03_04785 [bacterium K02(2017)]|nr:hypothetical protein BVY03_04785 [bacterium K02(2017)]
MKVHRVQRGDTLSQIARSNKQDIQKILKQNPSITCGVFASKEGVCFDKAGKKRDVKGSYLYVGDEINLNDIIKGKVQAKKTEVKEEKENDVSDYPCQWRRFADGMAKMNKK